MFPPLVHPPTSTLIYFSLALSWSFFAIILTSFYFRFFFFFFAIVAPCDSIKTIIYRFLFHKQKKLFQSSFSVVVSHRRVCKRAARQFSSRRKAHIVPLNFTFIGHFIFTNLSASSPLCRVRHAFDVKDHRLNDDRSQSEGFYRNKNKYKRKRKT